MTELHPDLIQDDGALARAVDVWRRAPALAVDTEFVRTDTFYPKLGLIQVCDGDHSWLVDPLAIEDFGPLKQLLADPGVVKVFHSCSEDLEVLRHFLGVIPEPLFDTQVAAGYLGYGFSRGYARLVEQVLGVELGKHETRSDWLRRPLTPAQCHYAAEDVHYLIRVYQRLRQELVDAGRLAWLEEDMAALVASAGATVEPDQYYLKVKGAWRLDRAGLARLQAMTDWRERESRERDKPRNRIVPDKVMLEVARLDPASRRQLSGIDGFHPKSVRRYGDTLLDLCASAGHAGEPPAALPAPLDRDARKVLSGCRGVVEKKARALGMAPEILARKKELEDLVRSALAGAAALPRGLSNGWRRDQIGEELLDYVGKTAV